MSLHSAFGVTCSGAVFIDRSGFDDLYIPLMVHYYEILLLVLLILFNISTHTLLPCSAIANGPRNVVYFIRVLIKHPTLSSKIIDFSTYKPPC
jgi:hypothetical protein